MKGLRRCLDIPGYLPVFPGKTFNFDSNSGLCRTFLQLGINMVSVKDLVTLRFLQGPKVDIQSDLQQEGIELEVLARLAAKQLNFTQSLENHLTNDAKVWEIPLATVVDYTRFAESVYMRSIESKSAELEATIKTLSTTMREMRKDTENLISVDEERNVIIRDLKRYNSLLRTVLSEYDKWTVALSEYDSYLRKIDGVTDFPLFNGRRKVLRNEFKRDQARARARDAQQRIRSTAVQMREQMHEVFSTSCLEYLRLIYLQTGKAYEHLYPLHHTIRAHLERTLYDETTRLRMSWDKDVAATAEAPPFSGVRTDVPQVPIPVPQARSVGPPPPTIFDMPPLPDLVLPMKEPIKVDTEAMERAPPIRVGQLEPIQKAAPPKPVPQMVSPAPAPGAITPEAVVPVEETPSVPAPAVPQSPVQVGPTPLVSEKAPPIMPSRGIPEMSGVAIRPASAVILEGKFPTKPSVVPQVASPTQPLPSTDTLGPTDMTPAVYEQFPSQVTQPITPESTQGEELKPSGVRFKDTLEKFETGFRHGEPTAESLTEPPMRKDIAFSPITGTPEKPRKYQSQMPAS